MTTLDPKSQSKPPCAARPDDWDLDTGDPTSWRKAVETCHGCPLLASCRTLADSLITRGQGPRAMIWAGVAYDNAGTVVADLDHHRSAPANPKRPTMVIRTAIPHHTPTAATHTSSGRRVIHMGR